LFCCRGLDVQDLLEDLVRADSGLSPNFAEDRWEGMWEAWRGEPAGGAGVARRGEPAGAGPPAARQGAGVAPPPWTFAHFSGLLVATVEVVNLIAGWSMLRPLDFVEDRLAGVWRQAVRGDGLRHLRVEGFKTLQASQGVRGPRPRPSPPRETALRPSGEGQAGDTKR